MSVKEGRGAEVDLGAVAELVRARFSAAERAVVAASRAGGRGVGCAGTRADTPFDLASVTKPYVAATAARLARRGELGWDEPLRAFLPELAATSSADVPLELFLAHRAGLVAHQPLFQSAMEGRAPLTIEEALPRIANARREECVGPPPEDGFPPVYSDMGYMLLGRALEARAGAPLEVVVRREVLEPLGLSTRGTSMIGTARELRDASATFLDDVAQTEDVAWRGGVLRGVVHDENAAIFSGLGLSGHAGLFGDARAVLGFGEALLAALDEDAGWLGPKEMAVLTRKRPGGSLLAGFDGRSADKPSSGSRVSDRTFGHLGFTGTSLWIDPASRFVGVLLTNRVFPTREHIAIREARPAVYDAMFDALSVAG